MGLFHAPFLPPDGLVMALDPNNIKSYPGTGTTIFDISGSSNNGTLTNGPTFNSSGYISYDSNIKFVFCWLFYFVCFCLYENELNFA